MRTAQEVLKEWNTKDEKWKYICKDENGICALYSKKPKFNNYHGMWNIEGNLNYLEIEEKPIFENKKASKCIFSLNNEKK